MNTALDISLPLQACQARAQQAEVYQDRPYLFHIRMVLFLIYVELQSIRCLLLCRLVGVTSTSVEV